MRTLFVVCFIFCLTASLKCQYYHSFIEANKNWSELEYVWDDIFTNKYKFEGDTVIENTIYQLAHQCYADSMMQNWNFLGFFREDSDGKVFIYDDFIYNEFLLYDFSLLPGDSIYTGKELGGSPLYASVEVVDSILIDGEFRKRIIFDAWFDEFWIEGIGSSTGPFKPFGNISQADMGWELLCVEVYMDVIYQNPDWDVCFVNFIDNYSDLGDENSNSIKIYPQPAQESSMIKVLDRTGDLHEIVLINALNQIVLRDMLTDYQYLLNAESLSSGMYIVLISGQSKILWSKIIITKN